MKTKKFCLKTVRFIDRLINYLIILIFILILLIGIYFVLDAGYVYYSASNDKIAAYRPHIESDTELEELPFTDDYVAWIVVDDTGIDYPIMQGETNSTYLNVNPYGKYSLSGSIFLDYRNASDFSDAYSLIYGHHMSGGYMFGCLDEYYSETYFDEHRDGTLIIGNTEYPIKAFAMLATDAKVDVVFNPSPTDDIVRYAEQTALFYRDDVDGRVIALSTCNDPADTSRTVVLFRIL